LAYDGLQVRGRGIENRPLTLLVTEQRKGLDFGAERIAQTAEIWGWAV
jgi:hypothetical protein